MVMPIEQEGQGDDHDAELGDRGLLQELPSHGRQQLVAGHLGEPRIGHQQVAGHGRAGGDQEDPEHEGGEPGGHQLPLRLFRDQVIGAPMKPIRSHTIRVLVWTMRATLKGISGNRKSPITYCRPMMSPNRIWATNSAMAAMK
jgi:hypothetical protein